MVRLVAWCPLSPARWEERGRQCGTNTGAPGAVSTWSSVLGQELASWFIGSRSFLGGRCRFCSHIDLSYTAFSSTNNCKILGGKEGDYPGGSTAASCCQKKEESFN